MLLALTCLFAAKLANKPCTRLSSKRSSAACRQSIRRWLCLSVCFCSMAFSVFRRRYLPNCGKSSFARVTQQAVRRGARSIRHLHALSLRFHLERQTGGVSRATSSAVRDRFPPLISYTLYSIPLTLVEVGFVLGILVVRHDFVFALITGVSLSAYIVFTVFVSNWRIGIRRA